MSSERQTKYGRSSYRLVREQLMRTKKKEDNMDNRNNPAVVSVVHVVL
ncbi:MAG: hypothetical protein J6J71_07860 [Prevotella sp.]|nr:hypothetical protein [Prevotella sp.]